MEVYVIFHCNEWQDLDSYRLIGVVSKVKLKQALRKIQNECYYSDDDMDTYITVTKCDMNNLEELNI